MYISSTGIINQKESVTSVNFQAKKIPTKNIKPEKVLDTMALMAAPMAVAGVVINNKRKKVEKSNQMPNSEFEERKSKVEEILKSLNIDIVADKYKITKNNVLLISRLVENPVFAKFGDIDKSQILWLAERCNDKEEQDAKVKFLEVVGKNSDLINKTGLEIFMYKGIKSQQDTEKIIKLYDYVTNNETLYSYLKENSAQNNGYNDKYGFEDLYMQVESNIELLPRIMEDENLKENFKLLIRTPYYRDENYNEVLDTLSTKKELLSNKNVKEALGADSYLSINASSLNQILNIEDENVINNLLQTCQKMSDYRMGISEYRKFHSILHTLLNTKELCKNNDIAENFSKIIETNPRSAQMTSNIATIIKKIDASEKLRNNQDLINNIGKILASIDTNRKCQKVLESLELME